MSEPKEVIVVCTGNTCRSPMGERLLAHALAAEENPLNNIRVISAGVAAYAGDAPSRNSVQALRKVGIDLSDHRSRRFVPQMFENALAIFVMTERHRDVIESLDPSSKPPVFLFRELMDGPVDASVPDPHGCALGEYEDTRDALAEAVPSILAYLRKRVGT